MTGHRPDEGFTLIELLVVIIIIGILAAIAIPTLLSQREKGWRTAALSDMKNASVALETWASDHGGDYTGLDGVDQDSSVLEDQGFNSTEWVSIAVAAAPTATASRGSTAACRTSSSSTAARAGSCRSSCSGRRHADIGRDRLNPTVVGADDHRMTFSRRRLERARRGEDGFGLIEVVVALGVMAIVLLALLSSTVFAVQATVDARRNQQAADYLNRAVEQVRSLDYADAVLLTTQLTDPAIVTEAGVKKFAVGGVLEPVAHSATGHRPLRRPSRWPPTTGTYTLKRYVTVPPGTTLTPAGLPSVRRVTVIVTWTTRDGVKTRRTSTLLTQTRRGLPLPNFTWKYNGPAAVISNVPTWNKNPGNDVDYGFVLQQPRRPRQLDAHGQHPRLVLLQGRRQGRPVVRGRCRGDPAQSRRDLAHRAG